MARRVLVVEHDSALRELIADVFAFEGYFVSEAENETSLLDSVRRANETTENHFDLIVLGLQTNGALDLETLVRLRASGCHTPTVVLASELVGPTGRGMIELEASFLSKPFALENLRIVANHVMHAQKYRL
jgi:DNA-binding response OmpR family regulator